MSVCRSCHAVVVGGRYCANCGASLQDDAFPLALLSDDPPRVEPAARRPRARSTAAVLALAGAVIAGLVIADRAGSDGAYSQSTATTTSLPAPPSASTIAVAPTTATVDGPTATTEPPWPATVSLPEGLAGTMVLGFGDGTVATLDLATGALRPLVDLPVPLPTSLHPLGDHVVVGSDGSSDGQLRSVSLVDGAVDELPAAGWVSGGGASGVVVRSQTFGDDGGAIVHFVRPDGHVVDLTLPPLHWPVTVTRGRVLVQVQGEIGAYDPDKGALVAVADGELVAANDAAMARAVCTIGECELRAGPWDDLDRYRLAYTLGQNVWAADLSPDGTRLLFWRPSLNGQMPGLSVIDLETRLEHRLDLIPAGGDQQVQVTSDGRYVVALAGSVLVFHPLDGGRPLRSADFPEDLVAAVALLKAPPRLLPRARDPLRSLVAADQRYVRAR